MIEEERTEYINKKNSKRVFIKKKFSITVKKPKPIPFFEPLMIIDEPEKKEERGGVLPLGTSFSALIDIKKDDIPTEKEKLLLQKKTVRKRAKKIDIAKRKAKKVLESSVIQKIFNTLTRRGTIDDSTIRNAAADAEFGREVTKENIEFFVSLGKARANLRKYGIPGTLCKHPFHMYAYAEFYAETQVFTNDSNVWNCIYSVFFEMEEAKGGLKEYIGIAKDSRIKDCGIITDRPFTCETAQSGYVQDYSKIVTIICPKELSEQEQKTFAESVKNKYEGSINYECTSTDGVTQYFIQYGKVILVSNKAIDIGLVLKESANVKCVHAKNNLQAGLKEIKLDSNMGSYINIHDLKTTDFSPSCLFITPSVKKPLMFLNIELETNTVFNALAAVVAKEEDITKLPFPTNSIFWDNIGSVVQMFGFLKLVTNVNEKLSNEMALVISRYIEYKPNILSWRRLYNSFENIVLTFYDKITTKIAIDGIRALDRKIGRFISDFNEERRSVIAHDVIIKLVGALPGAKMMQNFMSSTLPLDLVYSIAKLISILGAAQSDDAKFQVADLVKTIGYTCFNVLLNGAVPMIPKVRSKCSFLGGLMADMDSAKYKENIDYLVNSYKKVYADSLKEEGIALSADEMDDLVQTVVVNTIKAGNDEYLKNNAYSIAESVMSKTELLRSLREDVTEMLKSNLPDDIRLKGDFTKDDQFMNYLKAIHDVQNAVQEAGDSDPDIEDVTISILVPKPEEKEEKPKEKARRKMIFKTVLRPRDKEGKPIFDISKVKRGKRKVKIKKDKIKKITKGSKNEKKLTSNIDNVIKKIEEKPEEEEKSEEEEEIEEPKEKKKKDEKDESD